MTCCLPSAYFPGAATTPNAPTTPLSVIPPQLRSLATAHPYSTAFFLGSTLTLTLLSGAFVTRRLISAFQGTRGTSAVREMERRVIERVETTNGELRAEMREMMRKMEVQGADAEAARMQEAPSSLTPFSKTIPELSTELTSPSIRSAPQSPVMRRSPIPGEQPSADIGAKHIRPETSLPQSSALIILSGPSPPLGAKITTPTPAFPSKPTNPPAPAIRPPPSPIRPAAPITAPPRPSILAFYSLRQGIGKLGPMPIVDSSNPNYITFAEPEPVKKSTESSKASGA